MLWLLENCCYGNGPNSPRNTRFSFASFPNEATNVLLQTVKCKSFQERNAVPGAPNEAKEVLNSL